ncbi:2-phospho-L-lactate guanylyltransferase [Pseudonocardia sp. T1-2H]|uniref:2-phospho-L-lactate guanylyltransferase n=1 Tax=Pseudonocardia sp. T1-2H TaxID=3128899 RepID=UPI003100D48A
MSSSCGDPMKALSGVRSSWLISPSPVVDLAVDLIVPVKALSFAKTRLRGAADHGVGEPTRHTRLTLALAQDTVTAARAAVTVRRLVVVTSDPVVAAELSTLGVEVVPEGPVPLLNEACRHGATALDGTVPVGVLQADLPALRSAELDAAVTEALAAFTTGATSAFVADAGTTGTTFLLAARRTTFDPRFGAGSAARHRAAGSVALTGTWPSLRHDVDTADDLRAATEIGLGLHTFEALYPQAP